MIINKDIIYGKIIKVISNFYYVKTKNGVIEGKLKGIFRKKEIIPLVGDNVIISLQNDDIWMIEDIVDRKNFLVRPAVANVDQIVIVVSTCYPRPDFYNIDLMIAIAELLDIEILILITKVDVEKNDELYEIYSEIGYKVFKINNMDINKNEREEVLSLMKGKMNVLAGNSGSGKTSFINAISDDLNLKTREISKKLGRGKHTTKIIEMINIKGGEIIDTPGFSSIKMEYYKNFIDNKIDIFFKEFRDYIGRCKYNNCNHISETGCKIIEMKNNREISERRYENYKKLFNEIKKIKNNFGGKR